MNRFDELLEMLGGDMAESEATGPVEAKLMEYARKLGAEPKRNDRGDHYQWVVLFRGRPWKDYQAVWLDLEKTAKADGGGKVTDGLWTKKGGFRLGGTPRGNNFEVVLSVPKLAESVDEAEPVSSKERAGFRERRKQEAAALLKQIRDTLSDPDGVVQFTTYGRAPVFDHRHLDSFRLSRDGTAVLVTRGRSTTDCTHTPMRFGKKVGS